MGSAHSQAMFSACSLFNPLCAIGRVKAYTGLSYEVNLIRLILSIWSLGCLFGNYIVGQYFHSVHKSARHCLLDCLYEDNWLGQLLSTVSAVTQSVCLETTL